MCKLQDSLEFAVFKAERPHTESQFARRIVVYSRTHLNRLLTPLLDLLHTD